MSHKRLTYLACPYTHKDHYMMVARYLAVNRFAAKLMGEDGRFVFSPISHTHPIAEQGKLPRGWEFWECYDRTMIGCCDDLLVLCLDGWEQSTGVQAEIKIAEEFNIPIDYAQYNLTPSFEDMVKMALQMEVQVAPTLATIATVGVDGAPRSPTTLSSTYDSNGVCLSPTDVCSLRYNFLP